MGWIRSSVYWGTFPTRACSHCIASGPDRAPRTIYYGPITKRAFGPVSDVGIMGCYAVLAEGDVEPLAVQQGYDDKGSSLPQPIACLLDRTQV